MTATLHRIGPDDWREFRDVRLASLADAPDAFGSSYDDWAEADEQRWRDRLTGVPFTVVARSGGETVGVVSGAPGDDEVELISMWVAPGQRGTGLAGRLIDQVVEWAGERATVLMVREGNEPAIRAYAKAGFIDVPVPLELADGPCERRMRRG